MPDDKLIKPPETDGSNINLKTILEPLARAALNVYFPRNDKKGFPNLTRFVLENGRFPFITDEIKPWQYKGWLLAYVIEIQRVHPAIPDRYGYYFRTLDAGRLLDEPIPQIEFSSEFDRDVIHGKKELEKWESIISYSFGVWDGFRILVDWLAWSLGVAGEPPPLADELHEKLYRGVNIGHWLLTPSDYLGSYLSERKAKGFNPMAFFPTPHHLVELITRLTFSENIDNRSKTVEDCAVGTGRMLLHASNYSLRLYGQDIDPLVVKICKINGALFAPWLAFPIPENIFPAESEVISLPVVNQPIITETIEPPPINDPIAKKSTKRRKSYRTNEAQGLLFDFD